MGTVAGRGLVVVATSEARVEMDDAPAAAPPADLLRGGGHAGGDRDDRTNTIGKHDRPLEHHHPAHRSADRTQPAIDAEVVGQRRLGAHPVADGHHREPRRVRTPVVGMRRRRSGRALTTAEHVGAHDEVAIGVERLAGTDQAVPPAGARMAVGQRSGSMAVAGEGMTHEHGVAPVGIERAPGLVRDRDVAQGAAALEHERPVAGERQKAPFTRVIARPPGTGCRQHRGMDPAAHPSMMPFPSRRPALNTPVPCEEGGPATTRRRRRCCGTHGSSPRPRRGSVPPPWPRRLRATPVRRPGAAPRAPGAPTA